MTRWSLFLQTLSLLHHFLGLYWLRGEALLALGEFEGASDALRNGLEKARTLGNPSQLWKSWAALGRVHSAVGADDEA